MTKSLKDKDLLYIDIETACCYPSYAALSEEWQHLWQHKHEALRAEEPVEESYFNRAAIYAEFGKIICITIGYKAPKKGNDHEQLRLKSFAGDDEAQLLKEFSSVITKSFPPAKFSLCGHNIREFDVPYICRRMMVNRLVLPTIFELSGKKSWEVNDVDTLQLWKFGDYKHYTSLQLLAHILGVPSPKGDIEGKDVSRVYWVEKDLPRIVAYCQRDVVTVARLLQRFRGEVALIQEEDIVIVD